MTRKRRFLSHVEILKYPGGRKVVGDISPESTPPTSPKPVFKRRKQNEDIENEDFGVYSVPGVKYSPTVSDFETSPIISSSKTSRPLRRDYSPTVSDLEDGREYDKPVKQNEPGLFCNTSGAIIYTNQEGEVDEPPTILGETDADEPHFDDLPVRLLQDFSIFEISSNKCIPCIELTALDGHKYAATGIVSPWLENQEEVPDEDEDLSDDDEERDIGVNMPYSQLIKLTEIMEFSIHHFSEDTERFDGKIYIRTRFAWYILRSPSELYAPLFLPFFLQHRLCHLVISSALENGSLSYETFGENLPAIQDSPNDDPSLFAVSDILGRNLALEDLELDEVKLYILSALPQLCTENNVDLGGVPLIITLFSNAGFDLDWLDEEETWSSSETGSAFSSLGPRRSHRRRTKPTSKRSGLKINSNKELEVLKHRNETVVTPVVSRIVQNLFERTLWVEGTEKFDVEPKIAKNVKQVTSHHDNPSSMKWGPGVPGHKKYFQSVTMDGEKYSVGDVVMVMVGEDEDKARAKNQQTDAAVSKNQYANIVWFCTICYFFEAVDPDTKRSTKMFHGHWFEHGSKTILQETSHSRALYATDICDDNAVASIFRKCTVRYLAPGEDEEPDDEDPTGDEFFCGLFWDEKHWRLVDLPSREEQDELLAFLPDHKRCYACAVRIKVDNIRVSRRTGNSVTQYDVDYHLHEFVYVRPSSGHLLDIAQIVDLNDSPNDSDGDYVKVQYLRRHDDAVLDKKCSEERRLYLSRDVRNIPLEEIDGKCFIRCLANSKRIEQWIKHDDHFYLNQREDDEGENLEPLHSKLPCCSSCMSAHEESLVERRNALERNGKLRGLELFSGAGGLGTGMDLSGYVDTRWAAEHSPSAASTYKLNHPATIVYCQDTNLLLRHAVSTHEGKNPPPLQSNIDGQLCENMPKKGEVDFIFGGPPCQSFSRANHWPKADDIKTTLPCNMLSYLEWYEANFFLLENVVGILGFPLKSTQSGRRLEGGIAMGMVKLITRTLIALGYQVQYKVLQAGQYGAPQGRQRVIFLGAKRGLKLPEFPIPTHAFPKPACSYKLLNNTETKLYPVTRSKDPDPSLKHTYAPLKPVSVNEAIGDLPKFDWVNPHQIIPATRADKEETRARSKTIVQCEAIFKKNPSFPGFPHPTEYHTDPQNWYQKWMREKADDKVKQHFTNWFNARVVEATTTVPLRAGAAHDDLPPELQCRKPRKAVSYGRLDGDSFFRTALTVCQPSDKGSRVLHPTQKRITSVREAARAQGFPDYYQFTSINEDRPSTAVKDYHRQIGNAVPVPLASALGRSVGDALIETWKKNERQGSPAPV